MTDEDLLSLPVVRPEHAARYLQNGTTAQEIRVQAQNGVSPFCTAEKMKSKYRYRVNLYLLIKYKHGELGLILPGKKEAAQC